jgi:hypothetical protein
MKIIPTAKRTNARLIETADLYEIIIICAASLGFQFLWRLQRLLQAGQRMPYLHAAMRRLPPVERRTAHAALAVHICHGCSGFPLPQNRDDLFLGESDLRQVTSLLEADSASNRRIRRGAHHRQRSACPVSHEHSGQRRKGRPQGSIGVSCYPSGVEESAM